MLAIVFTPTGEDIGNETSSSSSDSASEDGEWMSI